MGLTCGRVRMGGDFAGDSLPLAVELFEQLPVVQGVHALARQYNNIKPGRGWRQPAKSFPNEAFHAIALGRETDVLFRDDETQARMVPLVGTSENQEILMGSAEGGVGEDRLKVARGKQPVCFRKSLGSHLTLTTREGAAQRRARLYGQCLATFGATASQNGATVFGGHAGTEAVGTLALQYAGLKCSFHGSNLPFEFLIVTRTRVGGKGGGIL